MNYKTGRNIGEWDQGKHPFHMNYKTGRNIGE